MGVMECALINRPKQSREVNPSARPEQLGGIRKAEPGLVGNLFSASRCLVRSRNTTPGYRGSRETGRMDCHQRIQCGYRGLYSDRCGRREPLLMSQVLCVFLAMVLILPVCNASDPCYDIEEVADEWRDLTLPQGGKTDHCDENRFVPGKWYSFHLRGLPAWIPTQCIKSNMCGANVGMRVDLIGQSLPAVGENITAALCGAYDVLGKYDCCVLRTTVNIARCIDDRLVYSFAAPFDRCPVAVCTQGENIEVPPGAIAKMGEDVNKPEDSAVTDIPDTTLDWSDSTTAETTAVDEVVDDTTSDLEESTESPAPPQPFMQQTTGTETTAVEEVVDDTTSDLEESTESPAPPQPFMQQTTGTETSPDVSAELSSTVTEETTPSLSSTDTPSNADVDSEDTDTVTTDVPPAFVTDAEASSTQVNEINTLTNTSSEESDETSELTTTYPSLETNSTDAAIQHDPVEETTSDNTTVVSSDSNVLLSTEMSTNEMSITSTIEPLATAPSISDEEPSSSSQPQQEETDSKKSYDDSADETTTITTHDWSDATSSLSSSSEIYEPASKSAEEHETETVNTTLTSTKTGSSKETTITTIEPTKWTYLRPSSGTAATTERKEATTSKLVDDGDVTMDETIRFVFLSQPQNNVPVVAVQDLLGEFLRNAKDDADWSYQLFSVSEAVNYENTSTYMDFRIIRKGNDLKDGTIFFEQHQLKRFITENSNLTLTAHCRASKNCQEDYHFPTPLASVFEQNAPAFTAIIVLCAICLLILILVVLYSRFSKRGSWKAPEPEAGQSPDNRRHFNGTQSPFTDAQIMKDEMVDNASASFNGSAKDGDTNLSGTWVIPLDQDASNQATVSITTEDTKF